MKKSAQKQKGAFLRMCSACGAQKNKTELFRIVRTNEGDVFADPTGKSAGRGAYLCKCEECVNSAKKSGRLRRLLRGEVPDSIYEELLRCLEASG